MELNRPISAFLLFSFIILSFGTISLATISPSSAPAPSPFSSGDSSLNEICKVTKNPGKCVEFVSPYLSGSSSDTVSVLNMVIEAVYKHVERAIDITREAAKGPAATSEVVSKCLELCTKSYNQVIDDLGKALAACSAQQFDDVNTLLTGAISNAGGCDKAFLNQGTESPMKEIDAELVEMIGYGVDISKTLI